MAKKRTTKKPFSERKPVRGKSTRSRRNVRKGDPRKSDARKTFGAQRNHEQRLQRALANAGLGSRRECEELIEAGRVEVDGQLVTKLGTKVDPRTQKIRVDGSLVKFARLQYFAVNKPPGVVSTSRDPSGRMRVIDLIKTNERVYNVGRLDKSSEGLILVTNDGDLANRLTHPRYEVQKVYLVQVAGRPEVSDLKKLQQGVYLAEGLAKVVGSRIKKRTKDSTWLEITLEEGRNREIRRLLASIGHKVLRLRRVAIGSLRLGDLPLGAHRRLEKSEIEALWYSSSRQKEAARKSRHKKADSSSDSKRTSPSKSRDSDGDSRGRGRGSQSAGRGKGRGDDEKRGKGRGRRVESGALSSGRGSDSDKRRKSRDSEDGRRKKSLSARDEGSRGRSSAKSAESESTTRKRKPKPKVGEKGWTPKSGGKRRKKKSTKVTRTAPTRKPKRSAAPKKRRK